MKKLLALIVSVVMLVAVFGCTPLDNSSNQGGNTVPETVEFTFE